MKPTAILIALLALAACGVESPPEPPEPRSGVTVGGEIRLGIKGEL